MKKGLTWVALVGSLGLVGCQQDTNASWGGNDGEMVEPKRQYEVDAWGSNPDIYEFTPKGYPTKVCLILVSGGDASAGIECFDKPTKKVK